MPSKNQLIYLAIIKSRYQFFHQKIAKHHVSSFIFGSILFWVVLTPIQEFINKSFGMVVVGVISFILLIQWKRVVLKKQLSKDVNIMDMGGSNHGLLVIT